MAMKYHGELDETDPLGGSLGFVVEARELDWRKYVSVEISDVAVSHGPVDYMLGLTRAGANRLSLALAEAAAALDGETPAPVPPADETRATAIREAIEALGLLDQVPYGEFAAAVGSVVERLKAAL
ncbi:hypothetical protein [Amycolatopsis orientalis]|uniref:hypothetical protein n=1 Tax=Amycolatopsis orientalis TaxID=31958 RepID=UPI00055B3045|nr:hypothetical protein [Amycolatopsis orientalis]